MPPRRRRTKRNSESIDSKVKSCKKGAERRGVEWSLTDREARTLLRSRCHYCGRSGDDLSPFRHNGGRWGVSRYNGIDQIVAGLGYTTDNTVACCAECNAAKGERSQARFLEHCRLVAQLWRDKRGEAELLAISAAIDRGDIMLCGPEPDGLPGSYI